MTTPNETPASVHSSYNEGEVKDLNSRFQVIEQILEIDTAYAGLGLPGKVAGVQGGVFNASGSTETIVASGAISLTTLQSLVDDTAGVLALTLAAPSADGHFKFISKVAGGNNATINGANLKGGTSIILSAIGDEVILCSCGGKWSPIDSASGGGGGLTVVLDDPASPAVNAQWILHQVNVKQYTGSSAVAGMNFSIDFSAGSNQALKEFLDNGSGGFAIGFFKNVGLSTGTFQITKALAGKGLTFEYNVTGNNTYTNADFVSNMTAYLAANARFITVTGLSTGGSNWLNAAPNLVIALALGTTTATEKAISKINLANGVFGVSPS